MCVRSTAARPAVADTRRLRSEVKGFWVFLARRNQSQFSPYVTTVAELSRVQVEELKIANSRGFWLQSLMFFMV